MTNRQWEANWQNREGGRWFTMNFETQAEAAWWAEETAAAGAFNANWQASTGNETQAAWTARNGRR